MPAVQDPALFATLKQLIRTSKALAQSHPEFTHLIAHNCDLREKNNRVRTPRAVFELVDTTKRLPPSSDFGASSASDGRNERARDERFVTEHGYYCAPKQGRQALAAYTQLASAAFRTAWACANRESDSLRMSDQACREAWSRGVHAIAWTGSHPLVKGQRYIFTSIGMEIPLRDYLKVRDQYEAAKSSMRTAADILRVFVKHDPQAERAWWSRLNSGLFSVTESLLRSIREGADPFGLEDVPSVGDVSDISKEWRPCAWFSAAVGKKTLYSQKLGAARVDKRIKGRKIAGSSKWEYEVGSVMRVYPALQDKLSAALRTNCAQNLVQSRTKRTK